MPDRRRKEIALLFDSAVASLSSNGFYAIDVAEARISGLPRPRKVVPVNSILRGNLLHAPADKVQAAMERSVVYHQPFKFTYAQQVYCVYVTNLSEEQANSPPALLSTPPTSDTATAPAAAFSRRTWVCR